MRRIARTYRPSKKDGDGVKEDNVKREELIRLIANPVLCTQRAIELLTALLIDGKNHEISDDINEKLSILSGAIIHGIQLRTNMSADGVVEIATVVQQIILTAYVIGADERSDDVPQVFRDAFKDS